MAVLDVENVMEKYMIMEGYVVPHQLMQIFQAIVNQHVSKLEQDNVLVFEWTKSLRYAVHQINIIMWDFKNA